jgi:hypothetical protein
VANAPLKLVWETEPRAAFERLSKGRQNRVMRPALRKGGRMMVQDLKKAAPKKSGALRASIGLRVKTTRKTKEVVAVAGAKSKYAKTIKKRGKAKLRTRGKRAGLEIRQWPRNYYRLVERGHRWPKIRSGLARRVGQLVKRAFGGGGRVAPHPFAGPAFRSGWPGYSKAILDEAGTRIKRILAENK